MLTIYGVYRSRATRNFWLALELGIEFRHEPVIQGYRLPDPAAPDAPLSTASPAFLAINPAGAVPCIEEDGFVLSESLAINLYLARRHGGPLGPADLREEALMTQWALYAATAIEGPALDIMYAHAEGRAGTPEGRAIVEAAKGRLRRPFALLDAHLGRQGQMVGDRFTVADINTAEVVRYAQAEPGLVAEYPALDTWLSACQSRPAFRTVWERRMAEPA